MAYSPTGKYPGATEVDPNYQNGKFKDNNPSTTNNGSPLNAIDRNELLARDEAIMNDAGFVYNDLPDTPQDSQLFNAYKASLGNGANLISNHNFLIQTPDDSQPLPDATPRSYPPGYQIFSGVFANETTGITNLTYINGRVSFSGGDLYFPVTNSGGIEHLTEFAASVADFNGKPRTRGVSYALVGDEYRVTVGVDALEDAGAVLTPLGSVKFEHGSVATGHEVQRPSITKTFKSLFIDETYTVTNVSGVTIGDTVVVEDYAPGNNSGVLFFKVVATGTGVHDGGRYIDLPTLNLQFEQNFKLPISSKAYGCKADRVKDDTVQLQRWLYTYGQPDSSAQIPRMNAVELRLSLGHHRITDQVHQPAWVSVVGFSNTNLNGLGLDDGTAEGSIIYADFATTDKTAWLACGWSLNASSGVVVGELFDPYKNTITSAVYDNAWITRSYGCGLKNVIFFTDKFVASAVSCGAGVGMEIDIAAHGFLTSCITHTCFDFDIQINGSPYHVGLFDYNSNATDVRGYIDMITSGSPPALDATTAPSGWEDEHPIHNPASIRFLTTGFYGRFVNSGSHNNLILEKAQRDKAFFNCEGFSDVSPYTEGTSVFGYHVVASRVTVTDPRRVSSVGAARVSSSGALIVRNPEFNQLMNFESQESFGAAARLSVHYRRQDDVATDELFTTALDVHFEHEDEITIYASSSGDDTKCGLNPSNAVASLDVALERAKYFSANAVEIADGETINQLTNVTLDRDIEVKTTTGAASTVINDTGGTGLNKLILDNSHIKFTAINCNMTGTFSGSVSGKGWISPRGDCGATFTGNISLVDANTSVYQLESNFAANVTHTHYAGTFTGANMAVNDFSNSGVGKVLYTIGSGVGAGAWSNTWTVV